MLLLYELYVGTMHPETTPVTFVPLHATVTLSWQDWWVVTCLPLA